MKRLHLLAIVFGLLALSTAGCKQDNGERCEQPSDCSSGWCGSSNTADTMTSAQGQFCTANGNPSIPMTTSDASTTTDATTTDATNPDAADGGFPADGGSDASDAVSATDASDAGTSDATETGDHDGAVSETGGDGSGDGSGPDGAVDAAADASING